MLRCVNIRTASLAPILCASLAVALGCSDSTPDASSAAGPGATSRSDAAAAEVSGDAAAAKRKAPAKRQEKPLPAFSGFTLEGEQLSIADLIGKRLLLFFFNPEVPDAAIIADSVARISGLRGKQNFQIVGIATGSNHQTAVEFAEEHSIDYPVIDDSRAAVANLLGLRQPLALLGVDNEGYVIFGVPAYAGGDPRPASPSRASFAMLCAYPPSTPAANRCWEVARPLRPSRERSSTTKPASPSPITAVKR